jgi:hypothetical protein
MKKLLTTTLFSVAFALLALAQPALQRSTNTEFMAPDRYLTRPGTNFHTSVRPYLMPEVQQTINYDSIVNALAIPSRMEGKTATWMWNHVFNNDLLVVDQPDFALHINPIMNFEVGRDFDTERTTWVNTRGFMADGHIGKNFAFASRFYENQASFAGFIRQEISHTGVIPGQGSYKGFKTDAYDFSRAEGYISYSPSRYFNFRFGHGRNFFGDGYRSLLLGDAHFPYPHFLISTQVWRLKYVNLYAEFMDRRASHSENLGFQKKYGTFHYLTMNVTNRFRVSLFEAVIWQARDSSGFRGFDLNYLNPVIFYRPVEFSLGSPDNAMLGLNLSYIFGKSTTVYGQLLLDEFKLKEITSGSGWWANKFGWQLGIKTFDAFHVAGLDLQSELNVVRPYTYSHWDPIQNFGHYSQPLAHPLGANFIESVSFVRYHHRRWHFNYELQVAQYGADTANLNFGKDPFLSYDYNRPNDYGVTIGQGLKTNLMRHDFKASWLINPRYNLNVSAGVVYRRHSNTQLTTNTLFVYAGLSTSLEKLYYDF